MPEYHQGKYKITNKHKYKGDPDNIVYRSSWELKMLYQLDHNPNVLWFSSEELIIKYISPLDNKIHRYFPDFVVRVKRRNNTEATYVLEIKPKSQTVSPKQTKRKRKKTFLNETLTYEVNKAKWNAATYFCEQHGWIFKIITEDDLGIT